MKVDDVQKIAVVGAGLMGHGIAQEFALAGYPVGLNDLNDDLLRNAVDRIRDNFEMMEGEGLIEAGEGEAALERVHTSSDLEEAVAGADVVIEAMAENLEQKLGVFEKLDAHCAEHTIFASNSSSYMPSKLAAGTKRPEKVVGAHYFNPPFLIPLVEIIWSDQTSEETAQGIYDLMAKIGKSPVMVKKEVPGFIANRIQGAIWREILYLVSEGVATPQDIDQVVKTSIGRRLAVAGPFELTELIGLDLKRAILAELLPSMPTYTEVPPILNDKVEKGELGVKTGKGFYDWTPEKVVELRGRIARALIEIERWSG